MKNLSKIYLLLASILILSWCWNPLDEIKDTYNELTETPEYQDAKEQITSWVEFVWEKTNEFIESNTWARLFRDAASEKIDILTEEAKKQYNQAKENAIELWEKAQEEAKKQYNQLKEDARTSVKESLNKKVDEAFDKI